MKRTIILILFVCLSFILLFSAQVEAGNKATASEKDVYIYHIPQVKTQAITEIDATKARAKKDRYLQAKQKKMDLHQQVGMLSHSMTDSPQAVSITPNENTMNAGADYSGDCMFMGTCTNTGSTTATFIKVTVDFYGSGSNYLGSDWTYVQGGSNVKLSSSSYTNGLATGQTGFFQVNSDYPYSSVATVNYTFTYETYSVSTAKASLAFVGTPMASADYSGDLKLAGQVKNSSNTYLTYFTQVYFAALNSAGKVLDVDFTYINGTTYNYGSGNTDTALQPGATGSFSNSFSYATYSDYSSYLKSFEWDESSTSTMTETDPPFGSFDTPINGSTVASSIAVTGWALDDSGVENIKIYRESGNSLVYVGDAIFVDGARPDVAAAYPGYPMNTMAGWGYMLLTNFLPNGGNGTFTLHAIATDAVGKTTTLGTKAITCDNANAIKPFGAIDTPTQGGTASGSSFVNWGWALTPQPNTIPTDGSTINVWVSGLNKGNPNYNIYRSDIANLFPSYNNSQGAIGYFYLDTTGLADGVHTIQWTAKDNADNSDGIGSRYFTVSNGSDARGNKQAALPEISTIEKLPIDLDSEIHSRKGFDLNTEKSLILPNAKGARVMTINPLQRVEIHLTNEQEDGAKYQGYLLSNGKLNKLPIGSTMDSENGIFYWSTPQGFMGRFPMVFVKTDAKGNQTRSTIILEVQLPENK
jgi:hypothetical protein